MFMLRKKMDLFGKCFFFPPLNIQKLWSIFVEKKKKEKDLIQEIAQEVRAYAWQM